MLDTTTITVKDASGNLIPFSVAELGAARIELMLLADGETGNLISPATETTLAAVLTELGQKLEPGGAVALDTATLAALEQITVTIANPTDVSALATETTLAAVLTELGTRLGEGGTVALDAASLAALETINVGAMPEVEVKNDAGNPLTTAPNRAGDVAGTLTDGRKTVTTPGTAAALRASLACKWVCVTALPTNTQQVNVGGAGTLAASGSSTGSPLAAGQSITLPVDDVAKVFVDVRVAGEGVSFTVGS